MDGDDVTVERLTAPSVTARGGVRLGGRTYGAATTTGDLGPPRTTRARPGGGRTVVVRVPGGSAALVTLRRR